MQLTTGRDVSSTIASSILTNGTANASNIPSNLLRPPEEVVQLIDMIVNTSEGAYSVRSTAEYPGLLQKLDDLSAGSSLDPVVITANSTRQERDQALRNTANQLANNFQIIYASEDGEPAYRHIALMANPGIKNMLPAAYTRPDYPWKKCSIFKINSSYVNPANKNTEAVSVYMNSIPSIEFSRAIPYIDVQFISKRSAIDADGRLNALSIFKFLEGAINVSRATDSSPIKALIAGNTTTGTTINNVGERQTNNLHTAGMELFSTPQTLINMNSSLSRDSSLRAVPIVDPTRPFLSFKSLNIDITSGGGFFAYKTGKLEFVLHDRSRLSEIADFIKPDMYGNTDVQIEYGWNHPDGPERDNVFADLLNASRSREKYMIRNVQFAFDNGGQVNVTLDIAMRGGNELSSETIDSATPATANAIRNIQQLADEISEMRSRLHLNQGGTDSGQHTREIRGVQILDAANDIRNNIRLDENMITALRDFRNTLNTMSRNGNISTTIHDTATRLSTALNNLWSNSTGAGHSTNTLVTTVAGEIRQKLNAMMSDVDDFMLPANYTVPSATANHAPVNILTTSRQVKTGRETGSNQSSAAVRIPANNIPNTNTVAGNVSLAKLLLNFIALPLARTEKFEEVQMLFYPFNDSAGKARNINIGQFIVDVNYFYEQYTRYRTESISRAATLNLSDFMAFINGVIIEDPAAICYGIGTLYTQTRNRQTGVTTTVPTNDAATYQNQLESLLRGVTPNGEFKMPQLQCYIEALPVRKNIDGQTTEPDPNKTILRLHFIDRQASIYQTQGAILASSRNGTLNSLGTLPDFHEGERGIDESRHQYYSNIIAIAQNNDSSEGILEDISTDRNRHVYVVRGGPKAIKDFVMKTMPYIIYGSQNTAIKQASLSSQHDAALSTVNQLRSFNTSPLNANGEQPGGLPLTIIPCEVGMTTLGCNLFEFTQQFFIDFQTGTTADNIYGVNALSHKLEPGSFETTLKFVPLDAFPSYTSFISRVRDAADHIDHVVASSNDSSSTTTAGSTTPRIR